jgi:hypothetical protein
MGRRVRTIVPMGDPFMTGCHCEAGWICEAHPDRPWPHDDCAGPGAPCAMAGCPWWRGPAPAAVNTDDWTDLTSSRRLRQSAADGASPASARASRPN